MSSPEKRKWKKKEPCPSTPPISSPCLFMLLPYDLLLNCVARVSRLYYPTLSLVSKSFQSLLASPELYKTRSLLGHTDSCVYVCMQYGSSYYWYTLCRKPDKTLTNDPKSCGYVLARVPIPDSPPADPMGLVAVGSSIYNIAESGSSSVSVLDCRSHTWREAPSFRVKLLTRSASVLDQKIYVVGCHNDGDSYSKVFEVLDTKSQIWDPLPMPCTAKNDNFPYKSACIDGKFHVTTHTNAKVVAYDSKEGIWDLIEPSMINCMYPESYCVIENVLYSAMWGKLRWYDTKVNMWRKLKGLKGLVGLLPSVAPRYGAKLADYGGKMVVCWKSSHRYKQQIWCAEIVLQKRKSGEIRGKVEWVDHVFTTPEQFSFVKALVPTL